MASLSPTETRPFGLSVAHWPAQWRAAWAQLLALPGLRALAPVLRVRTSACGDAAVRLWQWRHQRLWPDSAAPDSAPVDVQVALLSRAAVLERTLALPPLPADELAHAVQLEVQAGTPFPAGQSVYGWRVLDVRGDVQRVHLAITSRAQCQAALEQAGLTGGDAEIWLEPTDDEARAPQGWQPLVMQGWGEAARQRRVRQGQQRQLWWLVVWLALLAALAVTPVAFQRQKALQAQAALLSLQRQTADQQALREALGQRLDRLNSLRQMDAQPLALAPVLDMLTRALPDGVWLTDLRVNGSKLVLNGMADDAAALVRQLGGQPGVSEVRLASPATRYGTEAKERFVIELTASQPDYGVFAAPAAAGDAPVSGGDQAPTGGDA